MQRGFGGSDIGISVAFNPLVTSSANYWTWSHRDCSGNWWGMPEDIKQGDRVIVDPYIYCGHCYPCSVGRTNCCENLKVIGVHIDGAMQEVVAHPAHLIHKIPDNVPSEMAPLAELLNYCPARITSGAIESRWTCRHYWCWCHWTYGGTRVRCAITQPHSGWYCRWTVAIRTIARCAFT